MYVRRCLVCGAGRATGLRSCANSRVGTSKRAKKDLDIGVACGARIAPGHSRAVCFGSADFFGSLSNVSLQVFEQK